MPNSRPRGTATTPFAYPYRDNVMDFWDVTRDYVDRYLALYYDGDADVSSDPELVRWVEELDRLLGEAVAQQHVGLPVPRGLGGSRGGGLLRR